MLNQFAFHCGRFRSGQTLCPFEPAHDLCESLQHSHTSLHTQAHSQVLRNTHHPQINDLVDLYTTQLLHIRQSFNGELAVTELRQIAIEGDQSF